MLWEVEIRPTAGEIDREGLRIVSESHALGAGSVRQVRSARVFLIETDNDEAGLQAAADKLLIDRVVEDYTLRRLDGQAAPATAEEGLLRTVLFKPGVTDNVALSARRRSRTSAVRRRPSGPPGGTGSTTTSALPICSGSSSDCSPTTPSNGSSPVRCRWTASRSGASIAFN